MEERQIYLIEREVNLKGKPFFYYAPVGDDTVVGTYRAIKEDDFKLEKMGDFEDGNVIVDLGSNVGLLSCLFAKIYPCTKIYAFDVNYLACLCAKMNRCRNSITNLEIYNKAIGAKNEKDTEFYSNNIEISASTEGKYTTVKNQKYHCDMISIDEIFDSKILGIDRVKYLKIDIEGGEYDVMNHLCDNRPDIIDRIDYMHLEIHAYPWATELKEKVKRGFGKRWLNG
jgi:FkbM family methyltransferase